MAREEKPNAHVIEPARSGRSKCVTCGVAIADGELRLSEAYVTDEGRWARSHGSARTPRYREYDGDDRPRYSDSQNPDVWARFHHLACAARSQPFKLRWALNATTLEIPDRADLETTIDRALSAVDLAEESEATRDEYHAFVDQLRDAADDEGLLVFGDWLQSIGDPRGELVAVQHGLETATGDARLELVEREKKLLAVHRKHLTPDRIEGTLTWRRGFVHRVTLKNLDTTTLARVFAHPSLRLVRELVVDLGAWSSIVVAPNLPTPLPSTLRLLELRSAATSGLGALGPLLADAMPQLERLVLAGAAELHDIAHPTLAELEIVCADATSEVAASARAEPRTLIDRIGGLSRTKLPRLSTLRLRVDHGLDATVAALAGSKILKDLSTLALHGDLTKAGIKPLRKSRFDLVDVRRTRLAASDLDALRPLATEVVIEDPVVAPPPPPPPARPRDWLVRHTRKPEWGTGRVVEETEGGLQVEFEHGGSKLVRNVELLEEIEP